MCDDHGAQKPPPRWALLSMFGLVGLALFAATVSQDRTSNETRRVTATVNAEERVAVRFVDMSGGRVAVIEDSTKRTVAVLAPMTFGFVRTVMRGMAFNRRRAGQGHDAPFWISRRAGNQFYLTDPKTKRTMYLNAFGLTNAKTFGLLLTAALRERHNAAAAVFSGR